MLFMTRSLNEDFDSFSHSPEASKPAFVVKRNWREQLRENAKINGDLRADGSPDTSFVSKYFDATPDEVFEDYETQDDGTARPSW